MGVADLTRLSPSRSPKAAAHSLSSEVVLHIDSFNAAHIDECGFKLHVLTRPNTVLSLKSCLQKKYEPVREAVHAKDAFIPAPVLHEKPCALPLEAGCSVGEFFYQQLMNVRQVLMQYAELKKTSSVVLSPDPSMQGTLYILHSETSFREKENLTLLLSDFPLLEVHWQDFNFLALPR
jgi:hypothetical protein